MKKNKKLLLIIIGGVIIIVIAVAISFINPTPANHIPSPDNVIVSPAITPLPTETIETSEIILFYSKNCPYCENVENYIKENNIESKIKIDKKEVFNNAVNSQLMINKANECKINSDSVGVPFFYYKGQCIIGDRDIINFLEKI